MAILQIHVPLIGIRGSNPGLAFYFRDLVSPALKSRYDGNIVKAT